MGKSNGEDDDRPSGDAAEARRVLSLARGLLAVGGQLESVGGGGRPADRDHLKEALRRRAELNAAAGHLPPSLTAEVAAAQALAGAERALQKTADGGSASNLTDIEIASLEAIIEVTGRPSMRYRNGQVQTPPTALGANERWRVLVAIGRDDIDEVSASVGRISVRGNAGLAEHKGTGWCAAGGMIATNRHVAFVLAANPDDPANAWTLDASKQPFIEFAATDQASESLRFDISGIAYCAEEPELDVALLQVAPGQKPLPPPLPLDWEPESLGAEVAGEGEAPPRFKGRAVYVVGHPYRPLGSELSVAIFGEADGGKRWSPGLVVRLRPDEPLLEHDCSTLGGNSGSCVLTTDGNAVVGIHVGGVEVDDATGRGSANFALTLARLGTHRAAGILRTGKL